MVVTEKMTFAEYDAYCTARLPIKIPSEENDFRGDCQYTADGAQRPGPHGPVHAATDLSGKYVLLSTTFWYRRDPVGVRLPASLVTAWNVAGVTRGHRVKAHKSAEVDQLMAWLSTFPTRSSSTASRSGGCGCTSLRKT
jgi:hypothetical protein